MQLDKVIREKWRITWIMGHMSYHDLLMRDINTPLHSAKKEKKKRRRKEEKNSHAPTHKIFAEKDSQKESSKKIEREDPNIREAGGKEFENYETQIEAYKTIGSLLKSEKLRILEETEKVRPTPKFRKSKLINFPLWRYR